MHVFTHAHTHMHVMPADMHIHAHVHTGMHTCICICTHTCTSMHTDTHACTHVHKHAHTHASMRSHTCAHADKHTHTRAQTHRLAHTCAHVPPSPPPWCQPISLHAGAVGLPCTAHLGAASLPRTQLPWQCLGRPAQDNAEHPLLLHPRWTTQCIPGRSRSMQVSALLEHPARPSLGYFMSGSGLLPLGCKFGNASAKTQGGSRMVGFASQKCY